MVLLIDINVISPFVRKILSSLTKPRPWSSPYLTSPTTVSAQARGHHFKLLKPYLW